MKNIAKIALGIPIGIINALLGAGGGMIAVPILKKSGLSQQQAQAGAIAIILPLSVISAASYIFQKSTDISQSLIFIIPGIFGSLLGAFLLKKVSNKWLKRIFAVFMIWAGIRMMIR